MNHIVERSLKHARYLDKTILYETCQKVPNCGYFNTTPKRLPPFILPSRLKRMFFVDSLRNYKVGKVPVFPFDNMLEYLDWSVTLLTAFKDQLAL